MEEETSISFVYVHGDLFDHGCYFSHDFPSLEAAAIKYLAFYWHWNTSTCNFTPLYQSCKTKQSRSHKNYFSSKINFNFITHIGDQSKIFASREKRYTSRHSKSQNICFLPVIDTITNCRKEQYNSTISSEKRAVWLIPTTGMTSNKGYPVSFAGIFFIYMCRRDYPEPRSKRPDVNDRTSFIVTHGRTRCCKKKRGIHCVLCPRGKRQWLLGSHLQCPVLSHYKSCFLYKLSTTSLNALRSVCRLFFMVGVKRSFSKLKGSACR